MEKIKELRMTLVILIVGMFFISGCFFNNDKTVTFKTNGGSEIKNMSVKSGSKLEDAPVPTKDGYIFDGWYLDGQEYNFDKNIEDDITLVAKWIKDTNKVAEETKEVSTEETTTTTTTKLVTKVTSKISTTKKTTKKGGTTKKTTTAKKTTTTTTPVKTVVTTTAEVKITTKRPITPDLEQEKPTPPVVTPTEPIKPPEEVEEKKADFKLEIVSLENDDKKEEYIKIVRTKEDTNVISNIDDEDLAELNITDANSWLITSNHGYTYEYIEENSVIELKGDEDVTSFTVTFNDKHVVFDYDEVAKIWIIKYPTVSVGTGLDIIYYSDLVTAINVAKENDTIRLLSDQEVTENIKIKTPVTIEGNNYKVINKEGYLFDLENIKFTKDSKLEINNLVLEVDSFIFVGKSKFEDIILNNITGNIKNNKMDKRENGEFENTSILQHF